MKDAVRSHLFEYINYSIYLIIEREKERGGESCMYELPVYARLSVQTMNLSLVTSAILPPQCLHCIHINFYTYSKL